MDADISVLNLSVRSYNGLRRAGWVKVEDLIYNIESEQDLFRIRNMGKKSVEEVITKLIEYYLSLLSSGEKVAFRQNFNLANGLDINTGIQK